MTDHGAEDATSSTSDSRVETALAGLDRLDGLALPAQLDVFTEVQAALALVLDSPVAVDGDSALEVDDSAAHSPAS